MKQALRQHLIEKRRAIPAGLYAEKCKRINEQLKHLEIYRNAERVLFYVSTPEEVATHDLIRQALEEGKKVYVPRTRKHQLNVCPLYSLEELEPAEFGILEPGENAETEDPIKMDLIVVPGVGFDERGHRLGHGFGHYDRLLKATRGYKVGLAFEEQLVPELPIEEHDVPIDALLTDQNLLFFSHP